MTRMTRKETYSAQNKRVIYITNLIDLLSFRDKSTTNNGEC